MKCLLFILLAVFVIFDVANAQWGMPMGGMGMMGGPYGGMGMGGMGMGGYGGGWRRRMMMNPYMGMMYGK
uniref:Uncharacterized protein n=1 Tax=Caenorhabditis japonica TaxID=281687 RepID=A0A8R1HR67_CAEJA